MDSESNSKMGSKYKWEMSPYLAAVVGVVTVVIVLIPAGNGHGAGGCDGGYSANTCW